MFAMNDDLPLFSTRSSVLAGPAARAEPRERHPGKSRTQGKLATWCWYVVDMMSTNARVWG